MIRTHDLPFAAFLRAKYRFKIHSITKDGKGRVTWAFDPSDRSEPDLLSEFFGGESVPALEYANELKTLKSSIYST